MIHVDGIAPEALKAAWPDVVSDLSAALSRSGDRQTTLRDVRQELENERAMLWVVRDSGRYRACLVSFLNETRKSLVVWLMGGARAIPPGGFCPMGGRPSPIRGAVDGGVY